MVSSCSTEHGVKGDTIQQRYRDTRDGAHDTTVSYRQLVYCYSRYTYFYLISCKKIQINTYKSQVVLVLVAILLLYIIFCYVNVAVIQIFESVIN